LLEEQRMVLEQELKHNQKLRAHRKSDLILCLSSTLFYYSIDHMQFYFFS
jgi:hypothetical protein